MSHNVISDPPAVAHIAALRSFRTQKVLSQKELGKLTGLGEDAIIAYESGKILPNEYAYNKIAAVFGWSPIGGIQEAFNGGAVHPARLVEGSIYRFLRAETLPSYSTETHILSSSFRFEGLEGDKFVFRNIHGNWTVSLARNQLIGRIIKEVSS